VVKVVKVPSRATLPERAKLTEAISPELHAVDNALA